MKNKLFAFLLVVGIFGLVYLPGEVNAADNFSNSIVSAAESNFVKDVRYVWVRGKRYKVWYKTFYKKGKRYVRVTKIRRA